MPSHLRFQSQKWATHHVVSRCLQGFTFLKPTRVIRATTKGVLGYALNKYEGVIQLHHYVFLSNHFHLIISAETSRDLADFMCFFKGNLARELFPVSWLHEYFIKRPLLYESLIRCIFIYATKPVCRESTKFKKEIRNENLRFKEESKPRAMLYKR